MVAVLVDAVAEAHELQLSAKAWCIQSWIFLGSLSEPMSERISRSISIVALLAPAVERALEGGDGR